MNKEKKIISITIGLICFIIVYVMMIQFKTVRQTDISGIEYMRETELRDALANWKTKYEEVNLQIEDVNKKIQEYEEKRESDEETQKLLADDLLNANMILGKTDVEGQGIILTIQDNGEQSVTYSNILEIVNELNMAGAEAISINDERIISMTEFTSVGNFILINNRRTASPYTIKAIGDQTYLQSALNIKGGLIDNYKSLGYNVKMEVKNNIEIKKYNGEMILKYIK